MSLALRASTLVGASILLSAALVAPAEAHNSEQVVSLSGKRVVGTKGDIDARGRAEIRSAAEIETLCYKIKFRNSPPVTAAHIHQAMPGQNGQVVLTLFESPRRSPTDRCIGADEALLESMQASPQGYYLDLHTRKHPDGAMRGQLRNLNESDYFETCTRYRPESDEARKAGTIIVSSGASAEEPISIKVQAPPGTSTAPEEVLLNVQLTTEGQPMGFYARYEFPAVEDYDLVVERGNGEEVARADGFNPGAVGPAAGPNGTGGHSEQGAEQIDGFASRHCDGYTLRLISKSGVGGEATLKLWTGESQ